MKKQKLMADYGHQFFLFHLNSPQFCAQFLGSIIAGKSYLYSKNVFFPKNNLIRLVYSKDMELFYRLIL